MFTCQLKHSGARNHQRGTLHSLSCSPVVRIMAKNVYEASRYKKMEARIDTAADVDVSRVISQEAKRH